MVKITVRLPDELHQEIEKRAADNDRSLNAEIIQAIKNYLASASNSSASARAAPASSPAHASGATIAR